MIPNPGFSEIPQPKSTAPDISPELESANDPAFKDEFDLKFESLSDEKLFMMRKSHELQIRLGYREATIDQEVIDRVQEQMSLRGLTEEAYQEFLEKAPQKE